VELSAVRGRFGSVVIAQLREMEGGKGGVASESSTKDDKNEKGKGNIIGYGNGPCRVFSNFHNHA
jgi:hypothetical protein